MDKKVVIWGTGEFGNMAYNFYSRKCSVEFFVDSDKNKWEKKFCDLPIKNPLILNEEHYNVVVALKNGFEDVKKILKNEFGYEYIETFQINNTLINLENDQMKQITRDVFIINFCGGLGNQMFQYALVKALETKCKKVWSNIQKTKRNGEPDFVLSTVFKNINIVECSNNDKTALIAENSALEGQEEKFILFKESTIMERKEKSTYRELLNMSGGVLEGYFQTYYFADLVKEKLYEDYSFDDNSEEKLMEICKLLDSENFVSVHFRRGDYLKDTISAIYGNICTDKYYKKAIDYIRRQLNGNVRFCFFSNDMDWVKNNYMYPDAVYIESDMFEKYEDWYDMCLMSHCKHNIIANSTFSWWGAWLNRYPKKIVVAPLKWVNQCNYLDIYPDGWIKM